LHSKRNKCNKRNNQLWERQPLLKWERQHEWVG
jgi:hypothetical protein